MSITADDAKLTDQITKKYYKMTVALFKILNCQVNVYIIAKPELLIPHSIISEVIMKCL